VHADDGVHAVAVEGTPARDHLVENHAERVDVGGGADVSLAHALLGRHVKRRAEQRAGARFVHLFEPLAFELRDTEVEHLDLPSPQAMRIGDEKEIVGLEIAVHHVAGMGCGEGFRGLAPPVDSVVDGQRPARQYLLERLALEVLHHDVWRAVLEHAQVVDIDDVGVADGVGRARLGDEAADHLGIGGIARRQHLDRGVASDARMHRQIDLSHPPFSDEALDPIVAYARPYHPGRGIITG
jgi:hypothetical protein